MEPLTIVQLDELFNRKVEQLRSENPRIDDYVKAIVWLLERSPKEGNEMGIPLGPQYRHLDIGRPAEDFPDAWVAYTYRNNTVTLIDIFFRQ